MQRPASRKIYWLTNRPDVFVEFVDQQSFSKHGASLRVLFEKRHLGRNHFWLIDIVCVVNSRVLAGRERNATVEIAFSACIHGIAKQLDAIIEEALHNSRGAVA